MDEELSIIRKVVWSYVRGNQWIEFEDLFAEACLAYIEAAPAYNPEKGKKSTYIWTVIRNRLNTLLWQKSKNKEFPVDWRDEHYNLISDQRMNTNPESLIIAQEEWQERMTSLSPEARVICSLVLGGDYQTDKPRKSRGEIAKELRKQGWSHGTVWKTFRELKGALSL